MIKYLKKIRKDKDYWSDLRSELVPTFLVFFGIILGLFLSWLFLVIVI